MSTFHKFSVVTTILLFLFGCGGGGGGDEGVTYTGKTTPAVITDTNAKTLAEGVIGGSSTGTAFGVVSDEQEVQPAPTILNVARIFSGAVTQLDISPASATLPGAIQTVKETETCQDSGSISINLKVDDITLDFNGTFNFINCAEGGTTINGKTTVSGSLSTGVLNLAFDPKVTVSSGSESYTMSGTVNVSGDTIVMNVRVRNSNTQMVEWLNNVTITATDNFSFVEMTITGRYYHPQHGYIDIVTIDALRINDFDQFPSSGQIIITGASGSKARLTATSNTQYTLEVDPDGDDIYEPPTTENWG